MNQIFYNCLLVTKPGYEWVKYIPLIVPILGFLVGLFLIKRNWEKFKGSNGRKRFGWIIVSMLYLFVIFLLYHTVDFVISLLFPLECL